MKRKNASKAPYLTKRILVSAARSGIKHAAKETMAVMGFTIVAKDGWVIKKYQDGTIEHITPIESIENTEVALD